MIKTSSTWLVVSCLLVNSAVAQLSTGPTDHSGTIALGGLAQTLMAANLGRHGCFVQNQSTGDLWLNDMGGAAGPSQPAKWLPAGATFICEPGGTSLTAFSIYGAVTGQSFAAEDW